MRAGPSPDRIVHLVGVTLGPIEPCPETIVFHLQTPDGDELELDLHNLLKALGFACTEGVIPQLSWDWTAQTVNLHGVAELWS